MPETLIYQLELSPDPRRDIAAIVRWSVDVFGVDAHLRYKALIVQALRDLTSDPQRPGSKARPGLIVADARTYPISFSRRHVPGQAVKKPRHYILYRVTASGRIDVGRILHDSRKLAQHLPATYRRK